MSRMRIVRHVAVAVPLVLHAADITPDFIVVHLLFHPVTDAAVRRQAEAQPQMLGNRQLKRNVVEIDRIITCIERLPVIFLGIVKALPFKTEIEKERLGAHGTVSRRIEQIDSSRITHTDADTAHRTCLKRSRGPQFTQTVHRIR